MKRRELKEGNEKTKRRKEEEEKEERKGKATKREMKLVGLGEEKEEEEKRNRMGMNWMLLGKGSEKEEVAGLVENGRRGRMRSRKWGELGAGRVGEGRGGGRKKSRK